MNFYIGQEVVCINDVFPKNGLSSPPIKKGNHYIISDIKNDCCHCVLDIGISATYGIIHCTKCNLNYPSNGIAWVKATRFAPIQPIPESHEIAVKELIEQSQLVSLNTANEVCVMTSHKKYVI